MTRPPHVLAIVTALLTLMTTQVMAGERPSAPRAAKAARKAPVIAAAPMEPTAIVAAADGYLNEHPTMVADFSQVTGDGRRSGGRLLVSRPGRLRFTYSPPSTLEVVADGRSVAVLDRRLGTHDLYLIGQTPLGFLLGEHVDLAKDATITDVDQDAETATIGFEDHTALSGTTRVRLTFGLRPFALRGWSVVDPQGSLTTVSLSDVDLATRPDDDSFSIDPGKLSTPGR